MKNKLTDRNYHKYITTLEFNTLAADVFNAKLAEAILIAKTNFDVKLSEEKLPQINQNIYLLKMN